MTRLLAFSDLHLDLGAARSIVAEAAGADLVIGAGDFAVQRDGLAKIMLLFEPIAGKCLFVCGNAESPEELREATSAEVLHGTSVRRNGLNIAGLGGAVPPLPKLPWPSYDIEEEAAADLLAKLDATDILISHSPPLGVVDTVRSLGDRHIGSQAVADAARRLTPQYLLCGHVHDCWGQSGQIGSTTVRNLGPRPTWLEV